MASTSGELFGSLPALRSFYIRVPTGQNPGFNAGLYGHPRSKFCIKILGMDVGDNHCISASVDIISRTNGPC
jgi:hypothetical protein